MKRAFSTAGTEESKNTEKYKKPRSSITPKDRGSYKIGSSGFIHK